MRDYIGSVRQRRPIPSQCSTSEVGELEHCIDSVSYDLGGPN